MRTTFVSAVLCVTFAAAFWYGLTSSLTDMTRIDCRAGVQRACDQLHQAGEQL